MLCERKTASGEFCKYTQNFSKAVLMNWRSKGGFCKKTTLGHNRNWNDNEFYWFTWFETAA